MPKNPTHGNAKAAKTGYAIRPAIADPNTNVVLESGGVIEKADVATPLYDAFRGLKGEIHGLAEALQYDTRHRPPVAFDATSG